MAKIVDKYRLETVIGKGQFGKVYKGFNMQTSEEFAIKSIKREIYEETPKLKQFVVNEIQTLSRINNSHVVKFIEMITTVNHIYFIYEFCNGGTLEDAIFSRGYYQEEEALIIFKEIVNGLKPVVQMNIIHRDLKPQNILFHEGLVKIADFGFCKPLSSRKDLAKTILGSPIYMAPEILLGEEYTMKADIWSMGVIYYEMLFGICPFEGKNIAQLIDLINEYELKFPEQYKVSEKTKILVKRMLCRDSTKRIEWEEILEILNLQTPSSMKVIIPQKFLKPSFIYTEMNRIPSTQNTSTQSASLPRIFKSKLETKLPKAEITSPTNISNKLPIEEPLYSAANQENRRFSSFALSKDAMHSISINNLKTKIESKEFLNHSFTTNLKNENSISTGNLGLNSNFTNNSASGKNIVRTLTGYGYITNDMKDSLSTGGITSNIGGIMNGTNNITDSRNLTNNVNENIISNQIGNLETENNNNIRISKTSLTQDPIFKIKVTSKIENKEDFFKFLNKELNKIYYLTKVFTNLHTYKLETHYKSFELIFLKYLFFQTRKIKKGLIDTIDIETTLKIPSLLEYIKLPEYRSFEKEINFQFEKISILYSIQKKEFFKTNAVDSDLENDFIFNFKLFLLTMSNYIEEIKIDYLFTKHQKYLTFDASKYIIFLNELIDSVLIEELFNKFINENKSLDDQKYFQDIKLSPIDSLLKLVSQKIEFAKSKHNY